MKIKSILYTRRAYLATEAKLGLVQNKKVILKDRAIVNLFNNSVKEAIEGVIELPEFTYEISTRFNSLDWKIKPNTKIINDTNEYYMVLNWYQKIKLKWMFGDAYIQKEYKWIIGLVLSYGGGIITSPFWVWVYHHYIH